MLTHLTPTAPITAAKSVPVSQQIDQNQKLITEEVNPSHITQLLHQHQSVIQYTYGGQGSKIQHNPGQNTRPFPQETYKPAVVTKKRAS
jgi:hypothetical protein